MLRDLAGESWMNCSMPLLWWLALLVEPLEETEPNPLLRGWLVLFIVALVLYPNIEREGSQQWRANLKGDSKYQLSSQK